MSGSPVFNKGLHRLVPSEQSSVEKDACVIMGNPGQTSQCLWVIHHQHIRLGEEVGRIGKRLEMVYIHLSFFLPASLPVSSPDRLCGSPQSPSKAVGAG